MRERRILFILALTAIVGLGITFCTSRLLTTDQGFTSETPEEAQEGVAEEGAGAVKAAGAGNTGTPEQAGAERIEMEAEQAGAGGMEISAGQSDAGGMAMDAAEAEADTEIASEEGAAEENGTLAGPGRPAEQESAGADSEETAAEKAVPRATVAISPLETARAQETEAEAGPDSQPRLQTGDSPDAPSVENPFRNRLRELDARIWKSRGSDGASSSSNGGSVSGMTRNQASDEMRLWENELSMIYEELLDRLGSGQAEALAASQREWMKTRDAAAVEAAQNSAGGSQESVDYLVSVAETTRARAYELVALYENVLIESGKPE